MASDTRPEPAPTRVRVARLLLLLPFVAISWVGSYNRVDPTLGGVPFFYWYQMLWVFIGAVLAAVVYRLEH